MFNLGEYIVAEDNKDDPSYCRTIKFQTEDIIKLTPEICLEFTRTYFYRDERGIAGLSDELAAVDEFSGDGIVSWAPDGSYYDVKICPTREYDPAAHGPY